MMMNLKNEKGSITLFVLVSCMFFISSVVCTHIYMQSKQIAVNREYKQIKSNYEKDIDNMSEIYTNLLNTQTAVSFGNATVNNTAKTISINFVINTEGINIKKLKYGWIYSATTLENMNEESVTNWSYIENTNQATNFTVGNSYTENSGYYYLCVVLNNKAFWKAIPI